MTVISSIGLSVVLIISLRRIRAYTKTLATQGMIPDEKLLIVQEIGFVIAAFLYAVRYLVDYLGKFG